MKSKDERDAIVKRIEKLLGQADEVVIEPSLADEIDVAVRIALTNMGMVCRFENMTKAHKIVRYQI